jgi:hypothetical protein
MTPGTWSLADMGPRCSRRRIRQRSAQFGRTNMRGMSQHRSRLAAPARDATARSLLNPQVVSIAITLAAQSGGVRLMYRTKDRDGAPIEVNELVIFVYPPTAGRQAAPGR